MAREYPPQAAEVRIADEAEYRRLWRLVRPHYIDAPAPQPHGVWQVRYTNPAGHADAAVGDTLMGALLRAASTFPVSSPHG